MFQKIAIFLILGCETVLHIFECDSQVYDEYSTVFRLIESYHPDIRTIDIILNGPLYKIAKLNKRVLLYNLRFLQDENINYERKNAVYLSVKGIRRMNAIPLQELKTLGIFLHGIPGSHLEDELDPNNHETISLLGRINLDRKLLGVLAHRLKIEFGKQVFRNYGYINKFAGIICGYGAEDLVQIDEDNFILIDEEVFMNLDQCNPHQLEVLYSSAIRPTVYGIPQGWNRYVVRVVGTLLANVPLDDLIEMDPMAFEGLKPKVLRALDREKIDNLKKHMRYFKINTKNEFWNLVGIPSGGYINDKNNIFVLSSIIAIILQMIQ